ncbi:MAG: hypothetical protein NHB32_15325 [Fischerella sp. CENA71]|nr:hypothetical protein [Fischerella sp. CENA71]
MKQITDDDGVPVPECRVLASPSQLCNAIALLSIFNYWPIVERSHHH